MSVQINLDNFMDMTINSKLDEYKAIIDGQIERLKRRYLKNWVNRGLREIRIKSVYYHYTDLMEFIETGKQFFVLLCKRYPIMINQRS